MRRWLDLLIPAMLLVAALWLRYEDGALVQLLRLLVFDTYQQIEPRPLMRSGVTPRFRQIALPDAFLDAGVLPTLHERYGISAAAVGRQIQGWL